MMKIVLPGETHLIFGSQLLAMNLLTMKWERVYSKSKCFKITTYFPWC